jgi:microcompartment protein CcmK/EutM
VQLAEVIGSVTATVKAESLLSRKLLVVRPLDPEGGEPATADVAVDTVGAGPGDLVLVVRGSAARHTPETRAAVTDATIVAIVDSVDLAVASTRKTNTKTRSSDG